MKRMSSAQETRHLSAVPTTNGSPARLTRGQAAERLGISSSTVRRYEGSKLHPHVDDDGVHWFDDKQASALAAEIANSPRAQRARSFEAEAKAPAHDPRTRGEIAALVFERLEQRQSLPEIVVGLRIEPEIVRALFDDWCLGLTEGQLRMAREPRVPRESDIARGSCEGLALRLSELPHALTRLSVARMRGPFQHDASSMTEYAWVVELGGFHVSGPCTVEEITRRFGRGDYRITAYGFDPTGIRWEMLVSDVTANG